MKSMKLASTVALMAGALMLCTGLVGCAGADTTETDLLEASSESGSVQLALQTGDRNITSVTAVIEGKGGFATQTHEIDVSGNNGVISIFFGNLPVARKYRITLSAADCSGSASFDVTANQVALVSVPLTCGAHGGTDDTGGVQVTGTITSGTSSDCDHILKVVAAPSVQNGDGPASNVEVFLRDGVTPTTISWSTSSTTGGAGTIGSMAGAADSKVSFDCSANGTVYVVANVTAPKHSCGSCGTQVTACTEQARVNIECVNQTSNGLPSSICGNGIVETGAGFNGVDEVCDTNGINPDVFPNPQPASGSTCNVSCTAIVPPAVSNPVCGDGVVQAPEACDTNGANPDVFPNPQPASGSTCNASCAAIVPPVVSNPVCGDGVVQAPEVCDTNGAGTDVFPNPQPASGSTCNPTCSAVVPPVTQGGACLSCAQTKCPAQYSDAVGAGSSAANLADVTQLFDCMIGPNWEAGGAIPSTSCYFADKTQRGSLVSCYCGPTPTATCLATGPADHNQACGVQVEVASHCSPVAASCVTGAGSNPEVPLGDVLQLLNCERAACASECGFPPVIEE